MIKHILFKWLLIYLNCIPINRGKFFIRKLFTKLFGSIDYELPNGIWLRLFASSSMDLSYLSEDNPSHSLVLEKIEQLNSGDTFIDVGANIGYFTAIAARKVGPSGQVFAFEPSPREYKRLLFTITKNNLSNIIIPFNLALSDATRILSLIIADTHTGTNYVSKDEDIVADSRHKVFAMRLDRIVNERIHLIKIDVEGSEFQVVKGMKALLEEKKIDVLVIEITPAFLQKFGSSRAELYQYLEQKGYFPATPENSEWQYDEIFLLNSSFDKGI